MDWLNLFFIVALIYFFSSLQKRRKGRADAPEEKPQAPETPEETKPAAPAETRGGYDYERFRRKLRRAWKLPDAESGGGAEETDRAAADEETGREEKPAPPVPEPVAVPEPAAPAPMSADEAARLRRWQDYARRQAAPAPTAAAPMAPGEAAAGEPCSRLRRWTERDAEQWMIYDAVFGEPRSRRRWRPLNGERGR